MNTFELGILEYIREHFQCRFLDWLMPIVSYFGDGGIFWIGIAVVLLCIPKYRKYGAMMGVALLLGLAIGNGLLKNIVARTRPYDLTKEEISLLVNRLADFSFPSGHTLACFEAATVLMFCNKKFGIPALVIAVSVAFSRLYLFVHFPTDVFAGAILGTGFGIAAYFIVNMVISKYDSKHKKEV